VQWPSDAASSLAARRRAAEGGAGGEPAGAPAQQQQQPPTQPAAAAGGEDTGDANAGADAGEAPASEWFRKDANAVLASDGPADLRAYIAAAQPLPVTGLMRFGQFWGELYDLYCAQGGARSAAAGTGWPGLDAFYKVRRGAGRVGGHAWLGAWNARDNHAPTCHPPSHPRHLLAPHPNPHPTPLPRRATPGPAR
jgi:hypothetical protein